MIKLYRIQDKSGRGPFRPGFSHKWADNEGRSRFAPWYDMFPDLNINDRDRNEHVATACKSLDALRAWFTRAEYERLLILGYRAVQIGAHRIIAGNDIQCVFARRTRLNKNIKIVDLW